MRLGRIASPDGVAFVSIEGDPSEAVCREIAEHPFGNPTFTGRAWPLADVRHTSWLLATLATYVLAFLLYRRAFRFVPGEETCHNFLEEGIETVCHGMLIVTSLRSPWRRSAGADRQAAPARDAV